MRSVTTLLLLLLVNVPARGATVFVPTKDYNWSYGQPPGSYQDFRNGGYRTRAWLEGLPAPKLSEATRALKKEVLRHFELTVATTVRFTVLGPPRSTSGHDPYFFAWIEWVTPENYSVDPGDRDYDRSAGVARVAIEGEGERNLEIRDWHWEKDLKSAGLDHVVPWDAAVITRKMLDLHAFRPRILPERPNGDGRDAPF